MLLSGLFQSSKGYSQRWEQRQVTVGVMKEEKDSLGSTCSAIHLEGDDINAEENVDGCRKRSMSDQEVIGIRI